MDEPGFELRTLLDDRLTYADYVNQPKFPDALRAFMSRNSKRPVGFATHITAGGLQELVYEMLSARTI
jgi:hypothetical protein